jgi:hypothetical protein
LSPQSLGGPRDPLPFPTLRGSSPILVAFRSPSVTSFQTSLPSCCVSSGRLAGVSQVGFRSAYPFLMAGSRHGTCVMGCGSQWPPSPSADTKPKAALSPEERQLARAGVGGQPMDRLGTCPGAQQPLKLQPRHSRTAVALVSKVEQCHLASAAFSRSS